MATIDTETLKKSVLSLLSEIVEGPKDQPFSWIIDNNPQAGLFPVLRSLDANTASAETPGGSRIAAVTEHLRYTFEFGNKWFRGEHPVADWEGSWHQGTLSETQWQDLLDRTEQQYKQLKTSLADFDDWSNEMYVTGTVGLVPHLAYHLAQIKGMLKTMPGGYR